MAMPFNYTPANSQGYTAANKLKQNELVDYMILDEGYTPKARKDNPEHPSYKEGGLQVQIAIVKRYPKGVLDLSEKCFLRDEFDNPKAPNFQVFTNLVQWTPMQLMSFANMEKRTEFRQKSGGDNLLPDGENRFVPNLVDMLPSALPEFDYKNKVWADLIPDGMETTYEHLITAENARRKAWGSIVDYWNGLSENEALNALRDAIARRYLMCAISDKHDSIKYIQPTIGMVCRGIIKYDKSGKYISVETFDWNKTLQKYNIYSTCSVKLPSVPEVNLAKALIDLREKNREAAKVAALAKASAKQEGDAF